MASEITEEEENPPHFPNKEAEKMKIRQIIAYQKSLYFSSSSSTPFSSAAATSSSFTSPRKSSSLLELLKEGSTSLGRLFNMEHTSLENYLRDYNVSPIVKPILLWGSDIDDGVHDDPWTSINQIKTAFDTRIFGQNEVASEGSFNNRAFYQYRRKAKLGRRKLTRTRSYKSLPRFKFSLWRCGGFKFRFRFRLRLRRLRLISGRIF